MKSYVVFLIQNCCWGTYSIIEWFSVRDKIQMKLILLGIFIYLCYTLARALMNKKKQAVWTTAISFIFYFTFQSLFYYFVFK
ncbi:hypothetical protein [Sutcliffiella rhizosphaerae]|uniref:Uncharacterized protein n=1 Tax=Sutcliffiella rhizosphaerae TaxID=2880967 RepID=A0ABM8YJ95_9BACI|nr:hypothetical protein [Sutcliffiella rhizosphaerae]CAG9619877.1 hypothetical protein BACCIP111883_00645 [Sutcliffiella rhizosphaerae]